MRTIAGCSVILLLAARAGASDPTTPPLTTTGEVRAIEAWNPRAPHPLDLQATVTLYHEPRHLLIVQDDDGALALEVPGLPLNVAPGERISLLAADSAPAIATFPRYPLQPSGREYLRTLEGPSNWGSTYVARIRGFLVPPKTGVYDFWIASDDSSELWLGTDAQAVSARLIANVATWTKPKDWGHLPGQRSAPIHLEAGRRYYLEVLHEQRGGVDHLSVSWQGPGFGQQVIDSRYLAPWIPSGRKRDGEPAPSLADGSVLREYWSNCVIPSVSLLSAPRPLGATLLPQDVRIESRGARALPAARSVRPGERLAPADAFVWSAMEGVVDFVGRDGSAVVLELSEGALSTRAVILHWSGSAPERLLGQRAKLTGVAEPAIDPNGDRVIGTLWVTDARNISVTGSWSNPDAYPLTTIGDVLAGDDEVTKRDRPVRLRGKIAAVDAKSVLLADEGSVSAYVSTDGKTWQRLGDPLELPFGTQLEAGLAISSRSTEKRATAVFDFVQGLSNPRVTSVGQAVRAGELKQDGGRYILAGSGHDIWQSPDQFCFAHQTLTGAGEIVVRLSEFAPAEEWAKAGLMMRATTAADAAFVDLVLTGAHGGCLQWRSAGEASTPISLTESRLRPPLWMKLARQYHSLRVMPRQQTMLPRDATVEVIGFVTKTGSAIALEEASCRRLSPPAEKSVPAETNVSPPLVELARIRGGTTGLEALTPLRVRGIVTFAGIVRGRRYLSVQDSTAAAFIGGRSIPLTPELRAGRWIDIQCFPGVSTPSGDLQGEFGVILGSATLPKPLRHPAENALPRRGDAQWIELEGIGRAVSPDGALEVRASDALFSILIPNAVADDLRRYVDARMKIRGVATEWPDQSRGLLVQSADQIEVDEEPGRDSFAGAPVAIATVARNAAHSAAQHRTKIAGTVTYVGRDFCFVASENDAARIELAAPTSLHVGDAIEAIGFPDALDDGSLVLVHAVVRPSHATNAPMAPPTPVAAGDLLSGRFGGRVVRCRAIVSRERGSELEHVYELQMENRIFCATLDGADAPAMPNGSLVEVTGVCVLETALPDWIKISASTASILPVRLLLRTGADVVVLRKPRWWAVKRTLLMGGGAALVLGIAGFWIHVLRRRVAQRTAALNAAMEKLRQETQTAATLAERNRLAGEIHDSLEQGFSGLILQLDTTAKLQGCPSEVRAGLALARSMVAFSRKEIRHAVWDLHSPALDTADLGAALKAIVSQLNPAALHTTVSVDGRTRRLGSAVEHHLLRIAQEAIANAVKHAGAHRLDISLVYGDDAVSLTVRDDGRGFDPATVLAKRADHFGLRSLRGRAANVHGELTIESHVGAGTIVTLRVPLAHADAASAPTVI